MFVTVLFSTTALAMGNGALEDANCVVTQETLNHIIPRHCDLGQYTGKSKFKATYCTNQAAAQHFCEMVQTSDNVVRTVQGDNRIRYDATFGIVVGTESEQCGRIIIESEDNGDVVTQFPEFC